MAMEKEVKDNILVNPVSLATYIHECNSSFELESKSVKLHGDINYLYVIELDELTTTCYSFNSWECKTDDEEVVNGFAAYNEARLVYCISFEADIESYEKSFEDWDMISVFDEDYISQNEDKHIDFDEWAVADLEQYIREEVNHGGVILNRIEGWLTAEAYRLILIEIANDIENDC